LAILNRLAPPRHNPVANAPRIGRLAAPLGTYFRAVDWNRDGTAAVENFTMNRRPNILAGTALGLLMTCGAAAALPLRTDGSHIRSYAAPEAAPLILAQGEGSRGAEVLRKRRAEKAEERAKEAAEEAEDREKAERAERRREKSEKDNARKRQAEAEAAEERERRPRRAEREEAEPEQAERRREKADRDNERKRQAEAEAAEEEARRQRRAEREEAEREAEQAERRREKAERDNERKRQAEAEAAEEEARRLRRAEREEAGREAEQPERRREKAERENARERQAETEAAEEEARRLRRAEREEAEREEAARRERRERPEAVEEEFDDAERLRAERREAREERRRRIFDSDKEEGRDARRDRGPIEEARPLPEDDRDAQRDTIVSRVRPLDEEGVRVERRERRRERPEGVEILREMGDRLILQFGDQVMVESDDRRRLTRGAREVYTEELRNGRTRETIIRPNGTRIVTIRNVYGDVIRRSRFTPDGYEQVLSYVDQSDYDRVREWRDPGLDLPPIRIDIPVEEYILDAGRVDSPDDYYEFLEQPPVEQVQRLYSVDEVKRSARVRDIARRVDLDTITFEFGSASIPESEIGRLEGLAEAMDRMLKENPAETFLIEGHTDAVGSNTANLALSDRRAEAVALALTDVFGLPPENLTTQGYGEEYLKIDTEEPERENRRVAVRRITPLVAPVASAD
jgi:outer membrane protein OmpA-like peptidoglycan-associated protein